MAAQHVQWQVEAAQQHGFGKIPKQECEGKDAESMQQRSLFLEVPGSLWVMPVWRQRYHPRLVGEINPLLWNVSEAFWGGHFKKFLSVISSAGDFDSERVKMWFEFCFEGVSYPLKWPWCTAGYDDICKTLFLQLPGRATSFDSQGSCSSPKPPLTP